MRSFRLSHAPSKSYHPLFSMPGWDSFYNTIGWTDHILGDHMVYSHRKTYYTPSNFLDQLHSHDHYELLIPIKGDMAYPVGDQYIPLSPGSLMIFKPGCIHGCKLLSNSVYERHVFYFQKTAFLSLINDASLLNFIDQSDSYCLFLPAELEDTMLGILARLDRCLTTKESDTAILAYSYIIQLFHLINHHATDSDTTTHELPENIVKIKQYVEENYLTLNNITEIAEHFFYSREHVSRLFKECYNTNLSDYLSTLKVRHSKQLLEQGASVTDACYKSGFRNMSTFASIFRDQVFMNPSSYRKEMQRQHKMQR